MGAERKARSIGKTQTSTLCLFLAVACARGPVLDARSADAAGTESEIDAPPPSTLHPAGLCGFARSPGNACDGFPTPRYALIVATDGTPESAEAALRKGKALALPAGYPFAATFDDLPPKDARRRGVAVVTGLFRDRGHAERFRQGVELPTEIVELATEDEAHARERPPDHVVWDDFARGRFTVVELLEDAPAYAEADLRATHGDDARLTPRCTVRKGALFVANQDELYDFFRSHAPVRCESGTKAWVRWKSTRLESVVTRSSDGARIHQIVLVECDQATVEVRRFEAPSLEPALEVARGGPC